MKRYCSVTDGGGARGGAELHSAWTGEASLCRNTEGCKNVELAICFSREAAI
jgi:hypothetical protein